MKKEETKKEKDKKEEVKVKEELETKEEKKEKALVTCRVLFISALDKIYLVILGLALLIGTFNIFRGDIGSLNYGFWGRVGNEIVFLIGLFVAYLFLNWFYKCAAKTMLCLTKNEVYKETYVPFKRSEESIPLGKITKVSTVNVFWIFRSLVIHQYHRFPLIFMTWNNQEFKDKLNELITTDTLKVENEYEDRNIVTKVMYKYLAIVGIVFVAIILLLGFVRFFTYIFNSERNLAGTYSSESKEFTLNKNGTCEIDDFNDNVVECTWTYDSDLKEVNIEYEYEYSFYSYTSKRNGNMTLNYDTKTKTLEYNNDKYTK